jgi:outer membrane protein assembly factor BamB
VVANGLIYINPYGAKLTAFNESSGAQIWKGGTARNYGPNAILANGVLYDPRLDNATGYSVLEAYNASTGALLWTYKELTGSLMSPVVVNGALFTPARDNASGTSWIYSYALPLGSVITGPGIARPATR